MLLALLVLTAAPTFPPVHLLEGAIGKGNLVRLNLKNGKTVFGEVTSETADAVVVKNGTRTTSCLQRDLVDYVILTPKGGAKKSSTDNFSPPPPPPPNGARETSAAKNGAHS